MSTEDSLFVTTQMLDLEIATANPTYIVCYIYLFVFITFTRAEKLVSLSYAKAFACASPVDLHTQSYLKVLIPQSIYMFC